MKSGMVVMGWSCLACVTANSATAAATYSYTGNNYQAVFGATPPYGLSMRMTVTLELASSLAPNLVDADVIPIGFRFNDGVNTISETSNLQRQTFRFSTDAAGNVTFWSVSARTALASPSNLEDQQWEIATENTSSGS